MKHMVMLSCCLAVAGCKQAPQVQMESGYEVMTVSPSDRVLSSTYSATIRGRQDIEIYPQVLKNVRVKDKAAAQDDAVVKAEVSRVTEALGDSGRILLRQSGTEPVVRVMVEAADLETCEKHVDQVIEVMKQQGHIL